MRLLPRVIVALYASVLAWQAVVFRWDLVGRFWNVDDAFFYLTIARNIARGAGSTFDGIVTTNGYHPLWMGVVASAFRLTGPLTPEAGIRLVFVLGIVCAVSGTWRLAEFAARLSPSAALQTMAVLGFLSLYAYGFFGLEAHLNVLVAAAFFAALWVRWPSGAPSTRRPDGRGVALGLIAAALVLTRVDLVLWAATGLLALSFARRMTGCSWRNVVSLAAVEQGLSAALVLSYLTFSRLTFGAWLPISAVLHTRPTQFSWASVWFYDPFSTAHLAVLVGVSLATLAVAARTARRAGAPALAGSRAGFGAMLAVAVLAHCAIGMLRTDQWVPRYTITASCAAVIMAVLLAERLRAQLRWRIPVTIVATAIALVIGWGLARSTVNHVRRPPEMGQDDYAVFRKEITPYLTRDTVVLMVDDAGEFAWFCDCHLINGDGLVSNWSYQDMVHERRVREYMDQHGVQYVITKGPDDAKVIWVDGVDWFTPGDQEFRIMGFPASDALAHVGWTWLFRYPGNGFNPELTSAR